MKKLINLIFICLFYLIGSQTLFAAGNGACSWHGGVDCSKMNFDTMNVVCEDGWNDSSVSYLSVCAKSYSEALHFLTMVDCKVQLRSLNDSALNLCLKNARLRRMKIGFPDCSEAIHHDYYGLPFTHRCISYTDYCTEPFSEGYVWNSVTKECTFPKIQAPLDLSVGYKSGVYNPVKRDALLVSKLLGKILLQVQGRGEAWYLNPTSFTRSYMKDGVAAYEMMRSYGLGVTNNDLSKIPTVSTVQEMLSTASACKTNTFANRLKGRILIQAQEHGEAWYVDTNACKKIYMKDGDDAYQVMRFLGLGVTDSDLEKIPSN